MVDRNLRRLAGERAVLDAEELRWLREAARLRIWREAGCSTLLEYIEDRLGYTPRVAQERLRVALALSELPALARAMEDGEIPFSGVRELTRVATAETEQQWLDASAGKRVHEIEKLVSGCRQGDLPSDPLDPNVALTALRYEVMPSTAALLKAAKQAIEAQRGESLDDDAFLAALAGIAVESNAADSEASIGKARFQIAVTVCESCRSGWSDVAGASARLAPGEIERASCDAQYIGNLDSEQPERAYQDIPPKVRRFVWRRDRGKCRVPGCRATKHLEIHHIITRDDGGTNEPSNLLLLCDGHHAALHRNKLSIRGEAPDQLVFQRRAASQYDHVSVVVQAKSALVNLGFKASIATAAIAAATTELGTNVTLEPFIRAALRHCPRGIAG